jgi:hypothetical protein
MHFPKMGFIQQLYEENSFTDAQTEVVRELTRSRMLSSIRAGETVLLTAGSRGIQCMNDVLSACIRAVLEKGAKPIIFPAMGGHGRAEPQGQVEVLEHLGITAQKMGAPVYADMEMVSRHPVGLYRNPLNSVT